MISELQLEGYRGFQKYRVGDLTQVNLIVGRNNCGKTSVLEAVHLLASGGDPNVISQIAWQRGEVVFHRSGEDRVGRETSPDISHFFHGHDFREGSRFAISTRNGVDSISVRIALSSEAEDQKYLFRELNGLGTPLAAVVEGATHPRARHYGPIPVTEEGAVPEYVSQRLGRVPPSQLESIPPVQFISPDSLEPSSMSDMWDRVLLEGNEETVIAAMKILESDLTDIFFLSGKRGSRFGGRAGVLLGFEGHRRRLPMGSYGEGMRRLLALSLSLAQTAGGVLLVDEIDTGLHWSIMADMWKLVITAATATNTQVFATTHSLDCLKGLAWLCENHEEMGQYASVHKVDQRLDEAVPFDAAQIKIAVSQEIEMR